MATFVAAPVAATHNGKDAPAEPSTMDDGPVDSPTLPTSQNAWARFEFENGLGNEGTKILLVEWNPVAENDLIGGGGQQIPAEGGWEVSWEGKKTMVSLTERDSSETQRVYFLIPSEVSVPPLVTISQHATGRTLRTKPMPAIFTRGLGIDAEENAGKRGVLHTIWAKKRLLQLQDEIRREMQNNSEGVALEMVVQERQWIMEHFGLEDPDAPERLPTVAAVPPAPHSPRTPIGGRLGEKLRGLKLATSPADLARPESERHHHLYSISPDTSDIAVPSRSAYSMATSRLINTAAAAPRVASLDALVYDGPPSSRGAPDSRDTDDDLFALPISPRSPEMKKSPFSLL
ncbi:hypothetical protein BX600DRAFT_431875 [Xylariales sp. PMI_506]|nr:hypothetical protein BX600DRAFT_431875 [Xylariales sp. PMI_506]